MNRDHLLGHNAITQFEKETAYIRELARNYSISKSEAIRAQAALNLERIRGYYEDHPGCTQKHACLALNLSTTQVQHAVSKLRSEWKNK